MIGPTPVPAKILAVDDEPDFEALIRQRFRQRIRAKNLEFRFARHGEEALAMLAEEPDIELLLLDINMPVMDGVKMVEEMARRGLAQDIPVVIVSSDRSEIRMQQLKEHGVREYLTKPFTPESIRDILVTCLKERGPEGAPGV